MAYPADPVETRGQWKGPKWTPPQPPEQLRLFYLPTACPHREEMRAQEEEATRRRLT